MTERLALLAQLEAKPGMGQRLAAVLESARALAPAETGTVGWYGRAEPGRGGHPRRAVGQAAGRDHRR